VFIVNKRVINISFQASIEARSCRGMLLPSVVVLHLDMNISHCIYSSCSRIITNRWITIDYRHHQIKAVIGYDYRFYTYCSLCLCTSPVDY
jgi:hypothetical protein